MPYNDRQKVKEGHVHRNDSISTVELASAMVRAVSIVVCQRSNLTVFSWIACDFALERKYQIQKNSGEERGQKQLYNLRYRRIGQLPKPSLWAASFAFK